MIRHLAWLLLFLSAPTSAFAQFPSQTASETRSFVDRLGICYLFEDDDLRRRIPCVIASGTSADGVYVIMLEGIASRPVIIETRQAAQDAPPAITMDKDQAIAYWRDATTRPIRDEDLETVIGASDKGSIFPCYRRPGKTLSYCYRMGQ